LSLSANKENVLATGTPQEVLKSIVDGINGGDLDAPTPLYEDKAGFAAQPGSLSYGMAVSAGVWARSSR
jgi:hypothetical protein